jgi:hypothetical protein
VVAYQVMSNHYHLLVHAPQNCCSLAEVCRRYEAFHRGRKVLDPESSLCRQWQERMRDISWFMRHLQQLFTTWYNRSRPVRRRGSLWADRFKHTILEGGQAVWACWKYIENNPVRAGMVEHAGDYRFCTFGVWRQSGRHPFAAEATELLVPMLGFAELDHVMQVLAEALNEQMPTHEDAGLSREISRRVRYWVDGLVIGSDLFIREVMTAHHPRAAIRRILHDSKQDPPLACWRRLRSTS